MPAKPSALDAEGGQEAGSRPRPCGLSREDRRALLGVVAALLLTRLLLYVAGAIAIRTLPAEAVSQIGAFLGKNLSLAAWVRWDAWWYLSVVTRGYWFDPYGPSNVAFFPLLPLLIKGVGLLTGNLVVAGLVVANLAALGAILALWRWVRAEAGPAEAERAALWLLVYPFSFYFHTIYAESLFFLLTTLALHASARGRRLSAGLWGGLAAITRPMGVLLTPALAWGLWRDRRAGRPVGLRDAIAVLLPALSLGAYAAYLWGTVGDPLAFWKAHVVGWQVGPQWAVAKLWREPYWVLTQLRRVHAYSYLFESMRILLPIVFVALTVQVFRRLGAVPGIYASLTVATGIVFALESVGREFLAVTPAFAVAGLIGPRGALGEGLRLASLGLLVLFLGAFVTGRFAG
jgi:hypothetical protein